MPLLQSQVRSLQAVKWPFCYPPGFTSHALHCCLPVVLNYKTVFQLVSETCPRADVHYKEGLYKSLPHITTCKETAYHRVGKVQNKQFSFFNNCCFGDRVSLCRPRRPFYVAWEGFKCLPQSQVRPQRSRGKQHLASRCWTLTCFLRDMSYARGQWALCTTVVYFTL